MRFDVKALAITSSILWGLAFFCMTWWIIAFEGCTGESIFFERIYRGYTITPLGSIVGLVWGLVDGLFCGAIFGWTYNFIADRVSKKMA